MAGCDLVAVVGAGSARTQKLSEFRSAPQRSEGALGSKSWRGFDPGLIIEIESYGPKRL
jgi:hypothetical protein